MADAKQEMNNGTSQSRSVLAKPRLGAFGSSGFGTNTFGSILRPSQLKPGSNPFLKVTDPEDPQKNETPDKDTEKATAEERLTETKEDAPKFVPLGTTSTAPRSSTQVPTPAQPATGTSGFVFGQNLSERVVIQDNVNNGDAGPSEHSMKNGTSELLFTSAAASVKEHSQEESNSSSCSGAGAGAGAGAGLAAAAAEYERAQARPPPPAVTTTTGEEDEVNVMQISCRLFAWEAGSWRERGRGVLRLNDAAGGDASRLVARVAGSLRVVLNTKLWPDMVAERAGAKSLRITASDAAQQVKLFLVMVSQDASRLVARVAGSLRVVLNTKLWPDMVAERAGAKSLRITASDAAQQVKLFLVMVSQDASRLVARVAGSLRVVLNTKLWPDMVAERAGAKSLRITASDAAQQVKLFLVMVSQDASRLVARVAGSLRVVLNTKLWPDMVAERAGAKSLRITASDAAQQVKLFLVMVSQDASRLVARVAGSLRVVLNTKLWPDMVAERAGAKSLRITASDAAQQVKLFLVMVSQDASRLVARVAGSLRVVLNTKLWPDMVAERAGAKSLRITASDAAQQVKLFLVMVSQDASRLVARVAGSLRVVLNTKLWPDMVAERAGAKSLRITASDAAQQVKLFLVMVSQDASRLVARVAGSLRVVLNTKLWPDMVAERAGAKSLRITASDAAQQVKLFLVMVSQDASRLVARVAGSLRVVLNTKLWPDMVAERAGAKSLRITASDAAQQVKLFLVMVSQDASRLVARVAGSLRVVLNTKLWPDMVAERAGAKSLRITASDAAQQVKLFLVMVSQDASRLVARVAGSLRVVLNTKLWPDMVAERAGAKSLRITASDAAQQVKLFLVMVSQDASRLVARVAGSLRVVLNTKLWPDMVAERAGAKSLRITASDAAQQVKLFLVMVSQDASRLVARVAGSLRVVLNTKLWPDMVAERAGAKSLRITASDAAQQVKLFLVMVSQDASRLVARVAGSLRVVLNTKLWPDMVAERAGAKSLRITASDAAQQVKLFLVMVSQDASRLVARVAGSLRVVLNTKLWPDMVAERAGAKSLRITASDAAQQVKLFLVMVSQDASRLVARVAGSLRVVLNTKLWPDMVAERAGAKSLRITASDAAQQVKLFLVMVSQDASRLVARVAGSLRVVLNTKLWPDMVAERAGAKSLRITASDAAQQVKLFLVMVSQDASRLVARVAGSLRVVLNTKLWPDMVAERAGAKSLRITASDAAQQVKLFLVMGNPSDIVQLHRAVAARIAISRRAAGGGAAARLRHDADADAARPEPRLPQPADAAHAAAEPAEDLDAAEPADDIDAADPADPADEPKATKRKEPVEDATSPKRPCPDILVE